MEALRRTLRERLWVKICCERTGESLKVINRDRWLPVVLEKLDMAVASQCAKGSPRAEIWASERGTRPGLL